MKDISTEELAKMLAASRQPVYESLVLSTRFKAGQSCHRHSATRYTPSPKEAEEEFAQFLKDRGYLITTANLSITGILLSEDQTYIKALADISYSTEKTSNFFTFGDEQEGKEVIQWAKNTYSFGGSVISTAVGVKETGTIQFDKTFILKEESRQPLQEFYPWLGISLEEYFKAFMESKESILVMFGPPGTGKSTFLRGLITSNGYNAYLAYNKDVVESSELLRRFYRGSADILAYEDIDRHLRSREDGNMLMSTLLNSADGVVEHDKKIVFVTNLPSVNSIDPALLRVGRCFDILKFEELTLEQAATARAAAGMPVMEFDPSRKTIPLAEALAEKVAAQQTINRFGRKTGF